MQGSAKANGVKYSVPMVSSTTSCTQLFPCGNTHTACAEDDMKNSPRLYNHSAKGGTQAWGRRSVPRCQHGHSVDLMQSDSHREETPAHLWST